jgi:hypothetical protein
MLRHQPATKCTFAATPFPGTELFQVKFLFTTPSIDVVEKIVVYDVIDFFSDFGGFIGLFLGASW